MSKKKPHITQASQEAAYRSFKRQLQANTRTKERRMWHKFTVGTLK